MELRDARELAVGLVEPKDQEWVTLDRALGRVLAQPLTAPHNIPAEPRSRMDGYAVRSSDSAGAAIETPRVLDLAAGVAAAGHGSEHLLATGECLRILTGAPLPALADAVIAQENVELVGTGVLVRRPVAPGQGILPAGADVRAGEAVLATGTVLSPPHLAMAVAMGYAGLRVQQRPRVALLATGDELMELGESRMGPHSYCNNRHLLAWLVELQGGIPEHLGVARDDPDVIAARLAAADADLVITTGGIGYGDRDFILRTWERLGIKLHFRQLDISPGRSSALGDRARQIFFALPGNPWAAQVVFGEIIAPMLRRWQGLTPTEPPTLLARLVSPVHNRSELHRAIPGMLSLREGACRFEPVIATGASRFIEWAASPVHALIPPGSGDLASGDAVQVSLSAWPLASSGLFRTK